MHANISFMVKWPDRDNVFNVIPPYFRHYFPRLTCIIDCFEIFMESPKIHLARAEGFSNYKKHCTAKFLIGCNSLGMITFLSNAYGGRASDVQIVRESGLLNSMLHHPGDQILPGRGFTLHEDFATLCNVELLTPAFTKGKRQLSAQEIEVSHNISTVRIHIERVIGLMKNRFCILQGPLPLQCVQGIKNETFEEPLASIDKVLGVCAALTNMGESIVDSS